jgi:hypothetical protein
MKKKKIKIHSLETQTGNLYKEGAALSTHLLELLKNYGSSIDKDITPLSVLMLYFTGVYPPTSSHDNVGHAPVLGSNCTKWT